MVNLPAGMLERAGQEEVLEAFAGTLGAQIEAGAESVKGESKQVWLDASFD
jgi:hypothetical protein